MKNTRSTYWLTRKGVTLVEALIYASLLSFLMANTISYVYAIQSRNNSLMDSINYEYNHE